jgi:hypothetical protein
MRWWTPRRPSASLKRKLFAGGEIFSAPADTLSPASAKLFWGALAPTMACALVTLLVLNHAGESRTSVSARSWSASNPVSDGSHSAQNHWDRVTFDWTNHGVFKSSMGFTPSTNLTQ